MIEDKAITEAAITGEAVRLCEVSAGVIAQFRCEKKPVPSVFFAIQLLEHLVNTYGYSKHIDKQRADMSQAIAVCADVKSAIDNKTFRGDVSPILYHKLFELSHGLGAFNLLLKHRVIFNEPTQQPAEPTQQPAEPTQQPAEPTQQPAEPTAVIVFVDQISRLLEEEWVAAKAARQHALVASTAASIKDATNDLLIAIAQLGRAK